MDTIRKYFCCTLGQRSTSPSSPVPSPPSPPSSSKIASAILNSLADSPGVIVLVHESRKVDALKDDDNDDTRIDIALDRTVCTTVSAVDPRLVFISIREGVTVNLINHEDGGKDERLESHCRGMALTGTVQLLFGNIEDSRQPQSYILSAGDRLILGSGTYYIRTSTEIHSIYLNKQAYLTASVQYYPVKVDDSVKLMQFVQELTSD